MLVARIGERELAVVIENKGRRGGVVISALEPAPSQLDKKIADIVEDARRRDAIPAILVSPLAAADADTSMFVAKWLPLPLDRVQPDAYDLSNGRFLGKRTLFQADSEAPSGAEPKGSITFLPDGRTLLQLFGKADLSTVLHEAGHLFLEVLGDLGTRPDAPAALAEDYKALLAWLGVPDRQAIGREHHEKMARGFEAYLMKGRAPSLELESAFARFRAWLVRICRTLKGLDVELSDDVRRAEGVGARAPVLRPSPASHPAPPRGPGGEAEAIFSDNGRELTSNTTLAWATGDASNGAASGRVSPRRRPSSRAATGACATSF